MISADELETLRSNLLDDFDTEVLQIAVLRIFGNNLISKFAKENNFCADEIVETSKRCVAARLREIGQPLDAVDNAMLAIRRTSEVVEYLCAGSPIGACFG